MSGLVRSYRDKLSAAAQVALSTRRDHRRMDPRATIRIPIYGLGCGGGGGDTIERALARSPGVVRVYVNPATESAYVDFEPALTNGPRLIGLIEQAGYRAGQAVEA